MRVRTSSHRILVDQTLPNRSIYKWLGAFLIAALWAMPLMSGMATPIVAAPALQEDEPQPILLGEYVFADVAVDGIRSYKIEIPENGSYLITAVDEAEAEAFDILAIHSTGTEVLNDIFATTELTLEKGTVTLDFFAVDDAILEFVVLGQIGTMSENVDQPGQLETGSIYAEEFVSDARYARLTVPELSHPRQVLIFVEPGTEDIFTISAEGDDIGVVSVESTSGELLRFWTEGGDYLLTAEPTERRSSFSLIPFISGPPITLNIEEPVEEAIGADATEVIYELELDSDYETLIVDVVADATDLNLTFVDRLYDGEIFESSFGESTLFATDVPAGVYFIILETTDEGEVPYTLVATSGLEPTDEATDETSDETTGETVDETPDEAADDSATPIPAAGLQILESGTAATGEVATDDVSPVYVFVVEEPGSIVTVELASNVEDSDFDLDVGLNEEFSTWSSFDFGSEDVLRFVAPIAGQYFISVRANGEGGEFTVTATEGDQAPAVEVNGVTWGTLDDEGDAHYQMDVTDTGKVVTVILVSSDESDFDLELNAFVASEEYVDYESGFASGSVESVIYGPTEPGIYEIVITPGFSGGGEFFLVTRVEDPVQLGGQWAVDAVATSQYGEDGYSALQATAAPDTEIPGDYPTAWVSEDADGGEEILTLTYAHAVIPEGVAIYESYSPGAVVAVDAYDAANDQWIILWENDPQEVEEVARIFSPELAPIDFATDTIRIVLDTEAVSGWNEIDAVQLFGRPQ